MATKRFTWFRQQHSGFVTFILENESFSFSQGLEAYELLASNPQQLSIFLCDEDTCSMYLSGFEIYTRRIAKFFGDIPRYTKAAAFSRLNIQSYDNNQVSEEMVQRLLLPLLTDEYDEFHSTESLFELLASVIELALASKPRSMRMLAEKLGGVPQLLEKLASDYRSSKLMQEWSSTFNNNTVGPTVPEKWTRALVELCRKCGGNHEISHVIERWDKITDLKTSLHETIHQLQLGQNTQRRASHDLRLLAGGRRLSVDEKKLGRSTKTESKMMLSHKILDSLEFLKMSPPSSERAVRLLIEQLEVTETLSTLETVIQSFPCKLCRSSDNRSSFAPQLQPTLFGNNTELEYDSGLTSFEDLLGAQFGIWKIILSAQALKDLRESTREGNFEHIKAKLEDLASGDWRRRSLIRAACQDSRLKVPILKAVYGDNGRILWQVDIGFNEKHNSASQLVKIWKIGDHKEMTKAIEYVIRTQQSYSKARVDACKRNLVEKSIKMPVIFVDGEVDEAFHPDPEAKGGEDTSINTAEQRALRDSLMSSKFYTLTHTILDSLLAGNYAAEFPFDVSEEEVHIIKHFKTAAFILGRSGTGKTTCLIYKLLSRFLARKKMHGMEPMHQMLLTRSKYLSERLNIYTKKLIDSQLKRTATDNEIYEDYGEDLIFSDDTEEETTETLLALREHEFPLVCTFDHFLKLLENTIKMADRKDFSVADQSESYKQYLPNHLRRGSRDAGGIGGNMVTQAPKLIDFTIFSIDYWTKFPARLTDSIPVDLAFAEIMGVIKGSTSLSSELKPLSREQYRNRSWRLAPTFTSKSDRDLVYDIYESYEHWKAKRGEIDGIDRVKRILEPLIGNPPLQQRVQEFLHEVYIDEVQDQRPLEIELILNLVQNPRGIHFAGDTAQCISKDSTFRFANVKAMFYEKFTELGMVAKNPHLAKPELFTLSRNFRSHQGILSLASLVMELLWKGFPDLVDKLPPEIGQHPGLKPTFFFSPDPTVLFSKSDNTDYNNADIFEFGSEQVILVRDIQAQQELRNKIGKTVLVLTILQSKGMEFEDVFLYNFFSASPCISSFRSLHELHAHSGPDDQYGYSHVAMCSELRQLYVAVTRARNRLWILESESENVAPVVDLFKKLIEVVRFSEYDVAEILPQFRSGASKDPRKWVSKGYDFIKNKAFQEALFCFEKAGDDRGEKLAKAYIAELKGMEDRAQGKEYRSSFVNASSLFKGVGRIGKAAGCYEVIGEFKEAASIWSNEGEHEKAAALLEKGGFYKEAAQSYHVAGNFNKAVVALRQGDLFNKLVCYLYDYQDQIDPHSRQHYARLCNLLLRRGKISEKLREKTIAALGSDDEKENFFEQFEMTEQLIQLYKRQRRYREAFDWLVKKGNLVDALQLVFDHGLHQEISQPVLMEIYNFIQAGRLMAEFFPAADEEGGTAKSSGDDLWNQFFSSAEREWKNFKVALRDYFKEEVRPKERIKPMRENFEDATIRGLLDLTMIVKTTDNLLDSAETLADLPLEFIEGPINMSKHIVREKSLPPPVLLFLGLFKIPDESNDHMVLNWSPLHTGKNPPPLSLDSKTICSRGLDWVTGKIYNIVNKVHNRAREVFAQQSPKRCVYFLVRGHCNQTETNDCNYSHEKLTEIQCSALIKGLIKLNSLFGNLNHFYNKRHIFLMDEAFSRAFMGHRRFWQERLLEQLKYTSSIEREATVLADLRTQLYPRNSKIPHVSYLLQDLLFFRLKPSEWRKGEHDFSTLLELLQFAKILGVPRQFTESLSYRAKVHLRFNRDPSLELTMNALADIVQINRQIFPNNFPDKFCSNLRFLLEKLARLRDQTMDFSFCSSSVLSVYEDLMTLLILMSRPSDFLIPRSWANLYLPRWLGVYKSLGWQDKIWYHSHIIKLIGSFCNLVKLETLDSNRFYKRPARKEFYMRRSVELLAVSMANLGRINPMPHGYWDLWHQVQKIFEHKPLNAQKMSAVHGESFAEPLARSFDIYNGKDFLVVVIREANALPKISEKLVRAGVTAVSWDSLMKPTHFQSSTLPVETSDDSDPKDSFDTLTLKKMEAAGKILSFWQKYYPKVLKKREHLKTNSGQAITHIHTLLRNKTANKWPIETAMVMVTIGVEVYMIFKAIEKSFQDVKRTASKLHSNDKWPVDELETLQDHWEQVKRTEKLLGGSKSLFVQGDIGGISAEELRRKCIRAKADLQECKEKTEKLRKGLEFISYGLAV